MSGPHEQQTDRIGMYRDMLRSVPGLDAMYRLMHAMVAAHAPSPARVLVVGAGGGREIEELCKGGAPNHITAIDPSAGNLDTARAVRAALKPQPDVRFLAGTVDDLPEGETFDAATSLLVMHHLPDDGAKLAYLAGIRDRLAPHGLIIHADVCLDDPEHHTRLVPAYLVHADLVGASKQAVRLELDAIPRLPVITGARTRTLFRDAGLSEPQEVFRTLWYRCWIATRIDRIPGRDQPG